MSYQNLSASLYCKIFLLLSLLLCLHSPLAEADDHLSPPIASLSNKEFQSLLRQSSTQLFEKGIRYREYYESADTALACFSIIASRIENNNAGLDPRKAALALINLGRLYQDVYYDYSRSFMYLTRARDITEQYQLTEVAPHVYISIAPIMQYLNADAYPLESPASLIEKALEASVKSHNDPMALVAVVNMVDLALEYGDPTIAEHAIRNVAGYKFRKRIAGVTLLELSMKLLEAFKAGDYNDMVDLCDRMLNLPASKMPPNPRFRFMVQVWKSRALKLAGRSTEVPAVLLGLVSKARARKYQDFILIGLTELYAHYKDAGDPVAEREYEYQYLHMRDSLQRTNNLTKVRDVAFLTDMERRQKQVERLTAQRRFQTVMILAVSLVALMMIFLLIYHIRSKRKLRAANLMLYDRVQQLLNSDSIPVAPKPGESTAGHSPTSAPDQPEPADDSPLHTDDSPVADTGDPSADDDHGKLSRIPPHKAEEIYRRTLDIMSTSSEIFNPDFSIKSLAALLNEPYYIVSAAINDLSGSNFKTLLLDFRIREACRRLADEAEFGNQTIEAIASGLGFKSRTYFNSVFKRQTGLTPSVYMGIAREKKQSK